MTIGWKLESIAVNSPSTIYISEAMGIVIHILHTHHNQEQRPTYPVFGHVGWFYVFNVCVYGKVFRFLYSFILVIRVYFIQQSASPPNIS